MKKLGIVAFANSKRNINRDHIELFPSIAKYASENKVTHILFSGSTLFHSFKDSNALKNQIRNLVKIFKDQSIIFEAKLKGELQNMTPPYGIYAIEEGKIKNNTICQIFWSSKSSVDDFKALWRETFINKNRIIKLDGIRFLVWVCGEINFLLNVQSNNNIVKGFRHNFDTDSSISKLNYDVFFNPTHNPLKGLYGKYKERLKYMSKMKRYAIISLNVAKTQSHRTGAIFVFHNGKEALTTKSKLDWEGRDWVMEIIKY